MKKTIGENIMEDCKKIISELKDNKAIRETESEDYKNESASLAPFGWQCVEDGFEGTSEEMADIAACFNDDEDEYDYDAAIEMADMECDELYSDEYEELDLRDCYYPEDHPEWME
jgi:hypothetical protein